MKFLVMAATVPPRASDKQQENFRSLAQRTWDCNVMRNLNVVTVSQLIISLNSDTTVK